jgi:hypothetical protein
MAQERKRSRRGCGNEVKINGATLRERQEKRGEYRQKESRDTEKERQLMCGRDRERI